MTNLSEQLQAKTEAFKLAVADAKTANTEKLENNLAEAKAKTAKESPFAVFSFLSALKINTYKSPHR